MRPTVAVVDYGMGNLHSVARALEAADARPLRTDRPADVAGADGIVLPGVGAFPEAMARLEAAGLAQALRGAARDGVPLLGVCLGMQLLFEASEEEGGAAGLGLFPGRVVALPGGPGLKVPHMGWNTVSWEAGFPLFEGLEPPAYFYFVHSFCVPAAGAAPRAPEGDGGPGAAGPLAAAGMPEGPRVATCRHGIAFVAAVADGDIFGTQFHPEKSGAAGLTVYRNFVGRCRARRSGCPAGEGGGALCR